MRKTVKKLFLFGTLMLFLSVSVFRPMKAEAATTQPANTFATKNNPYTGLTYYHDNRFLGYKICNGIDVSRHQGDINWAKVKAAGIDFAFIRCGYTSWANAFKMNSDSKFAQNMRNASKAGIKLGVYYYAQAKTDSEARKEATYALNLINPFKAYIDLPVVYDFENPEGSSRAAKISRAQLDRNTKIFYDYVSRAGYTPMNYGSYYKLRDFFYKSTIEKYPIWLARYNNVAVRTDPYSFWQYSSAGKVPGIAGNVDMDFYYAKSSLNNYIANGRDIITTAPVPSYGLSKVGSFRQSLKTATSITLRWSKVTGASGYEIYRSTSPNGNYSLVKTIKSSSTTSWKNTKRAKNRQYYYRIRAYQDKDGMRYYSSYSSIAGATKQYTLRYRRAKSTLNVRSYPGTAYSKKGTLKKNKRVKVLYKTYDNKGVAWYKVSYSGKTGYVSGKFLK